MKRKLYVLGIALIVLIGLISIFLLRNKTSCSTPNLREEYLNQLSNLRGVHITSEVTIDNYIVSGYTGSNGSYGIAIFQPANGTNYKFQNNVTCSSDEVLATTVVINQIAYDLFWANQSDLNFAEISYTTSSGSQKYNLDASNNKILYLKSPDNDYTVSAVFVASDGTCYQ